MSPGDAPPCQVVETERVQAPFTLSDTLTWPVESNCPNSPTKRSPAVTAPSVTVVLVTRLPVTKVVPCTKVMGKLADGVTALEGDEAAPVPTALVAVTVKVYEVPFVSP